MLSHQLAVWYSQGHGPRGSGGVGILSASQAVRVLPYATRIHALRARCGGTDRQAAGRQSYPWSYSSRGQAAHDAMAGLQRVCRGWKKRAHAHGRRGKPTIGKYDDGRARRAVDGEVVDGGTLRREITIRVVWHEAHDKDGEGPDPSRWQCCPQEGFLPLRRAAPLRDPLAAQPVYG